MGEGECDVSPSPLRAMVLLWAHTAPSPITHAPTHAPFSLLARSCPVSSSLKAASSSLALLGGWDPVSAHWTATLFSGALSPTRSQGPSLLAGWDSLLSVQCESGWLTRVHRYARPLSVTGEKGAPRPSVGSLFPLQHATWVTKCPFIQVSTKLHPSWSLPDSLWGEAAENARGSPTLSLGFKDGAISPRMNPWQSSPRLHT